MNTEYQDFSHIIERPSKKPVQNGVVGLNQHLSHGLSTFYQAYIMQAFSVTGVNDYSDFANVGEIC